MRKKTAVTETDCVLCEVRTLVETVKRPEPSIIKRPAPSIIKRRDIHV